MQVTTEDGGRLNAFAKEPRMEVMDAENGTRQPDGRVNHPLPGAALLAARTGAQLLPVAIVNSHRALGSGGQWPRLVPIQLRIGEPIPAPTGRRRADLDATTAELQRRINALLDQGLLRP